MAGLKRSCRCAEVTEANVGQEMTLMGWVQKSRNKGGIIFTDLRDRSGIIQIIFEESDCGAESFAKAEKLRSDIKRHWGFFISYLCIVNQNGWRCNRW